MVLAGLLSLVLVLTGCGKALPTAAQNYFDQNIAAIDLQTPESAASALSLLPGQESTAVYLAGEFHATQKSFAAQKAMVQFLHEQRGVNGILLEGGVAGELVLQHYIDTGDEAVLARYMRALKGTLSYNQGVKEFFQWLCAYQAAQPEDRKLRLMGLDVDHQLETGFWGLQLLLQREAAPPEEIRAMVEQIGAAIGHDKPLLQRLVEDRQQNEAAYTAFLGQDAGAFAIALQNMLVTYDYYETRDAKNSDKEAAIRENAMMDNFRQWYEVYPNETFFGQFGSEHIYQARLESSYYTREETRFGVQLAGDGSPVAGRVCSILYQYPGRLELRGKDGKVWKEKGEALSVDLSRSIKTDSLLALAGEGSPFAQSSLLFAGKGEGETDTAYVQYLLFLPNSPACEPYVPQ